MRHTLSISLLSAGLLAWSLLGGYAVSEETKPAPSAEKPATAEKAKQKAEQKQAEKPLEQTIPFSDKPSTYPSVCPEPPQNVGKENYQESRLTLAGLPGLNINIDDVIKGAKSKNVKLLPNLKEEVVKRLNLAGLRLLSTEEMEKTLGQPQMSMFPSFPKHLGPFKPGEPRIEYKADCCVAGIWTSFTQGGNTLRHPTINHKVATWGEGHNTNDCSDLGKWLSEVVLKTVDDFIAEKQKGEEALAKLGKEPAATPVVAEKPTASEPAVSTVAETPVATPAEAKPTEKVAVSANKPIEIHASNDTTALACDTVILLYAEIFPTASASISNNRGGILAKVAENMKACPHYRYRVETHSDQRADTEYNEVLSARRAVAIRNYLVEQGVNEDQFDLRFYGERKPLVAGETEEAYAANRRVLITPIKPQ